MTHPTHRALLSLILLLGCQPPATGELSDAGADIADAAEDLPTAGQAPAITEADCRAALDGLGVRYDYLGDRSHSGPAGTAVTAREVALHDLGAGRRLEYFDGSAGLHTSCVAGIAFARVADELGATDVTHVGSIYVRYIDGTSALSSHSFGAAVDVRTIRTPTDTWSVADWPSDRRPEIREAFEAEFELVLGPWNDAAHTDHIHAERAIGAGTAPTMIPRSPVFTVEGAPEVWIESGRYRHHVAAPSVLFALGFGWADVQRRTSAEAGSILVGPPIGPDGALLGTPDVTTIWSTAGGERHRFEGAWTEPDFTAATGWTFEATFVSPRAAGVLDLYPEGAPITLGGVVPAPAPAPAGARRVSLTWTPVARTAPVHYLMGMRELGAGSFGTWERLGDAVYDGPIVIELDVSAEVTAVVVSPTGDDDLDVYDGARYWWRDGDRLDARVDGAAVTWDWYVDPAGNRNIRVPAR